MPDVWTVYLDTDSRDTKASSLWFSNGDLEIAGVDIDELSDKIVAEMHKLGARLPRLQVRKAGPFTTLRVGGLTY